MRSIGGRDCGEYFQELGRVVQDRWASANRDSEKFAELACQALVDLPPEGVTPAALLAWVRRSPGLPQQQDLFGQFGEPPLCVFHSDRFYIQTLFWLNGTTTIHQHKFSGAFHVLSGSSIHSHYSFRADDRINEGMQFGQLELREAELLKQGQTRPILSGSRLIHALFHLDRPSVTLVIRTPTDSEAGPQYNYLPPGFAKDPITTADEQDVRIEQSLTLLHRYDPEAYEAALAELVEQPIFTRPVLALEHANRSGVSKDHLHTLLERARARHGERARRLEPVLAETTRLNHITRMRAHVTDPHHRFFLALLLNLPRAELVTKLVGAHHPDRNPEALIMSWIEELSRISIGEGSSNPLGVDVGDAQGIIFRQLMAGASTERIVAELRAAHYEMDGEEAQVDEFCRQLKASSVLRPLFA